MISAGGSGFVQTRRRTETRRRGSTRPVPRLQPRRRLCWHRQVNPILKIFYIIVFAFVSTHFWLSGLLSLLLLTCLLLASFTRSALLNYRRAASKHAS